MMLSIFGIVIIGVAVWQMIGYESSAPLTEAEVDSRLKEILSRLVNEISINNFAFGGYAPDYEHIVDEYHLNLIFHGHTFQLHLLNNRILQERPEHCYYLV